MRPRVLLVDPDQRSLLELEEILRGRIEVIGVSHSGEGAVRLVEELSPEVVLMEALLPGMSGIDTTRELSRRFPRVATVLLGDGPDFGLMREAMGAGARDFLPRPFSPAELDQVLRRQMDYVRSQRLREGRSGGRPGAGIWAFGSPCGGVGRTTLLLAIAAELAAREGTVLVADFDLSFGAVPFYTGIETGARHLGDLARREPLLPALVEQYLHEHPAGFRVLAGPGHCLKGHGIRQDRVVEATKETFERFDHVLVDLPGGVPEGFVEVLDEARYVVVPMSGDIGALRKVRLYLQLLAEMGRAPEGIHPVVIGEDETAPALREARQVLRSFAVAPPRWIPPDRAACEAAALASEPVTSHAPSGAYAGAVRELIDALTATPAAMPDSSELALG